MENELNRLLKKALAPKNEPDFWLNQKILQQEKERNFMIKKKKRIPTILAFSMLGVCLLCGAGFAAQKYLSAHQVAENMENKKLADAFKQEGAVYINETKNDNGYAFTLLGLVSGDGITDYIPTDDNILLSNRTYAVLAIAHSDGSPMSDISNAEYATEHMFVSPFIEGLQPWLCNIGSLNGACQEIYSDGVIYRLIECDNLEIFADHTIYLCAQTGVFYDPEAYVYDEASGKISPSEGYDGVNVLFTLPLDAAKADPEAAETYIRENGLRIDPEAASESQAFEGAAFDEKENTNPALSEETGEASEEKMQWDTEQGAEAERAGMEFFEKLTPENIDQYAEAVEHTVQTVTPKDGVFEVSYATTGPLKNIRFPKKSSLDSSVYTHTVSMADFFPDGKPGMSDRFSGAIGKGEDGLDGLYIEAYTLNEDGTVTIAVYLPKK